MNGKYSSVHTVLKGLRFCKHFRIQLNIGMANIHPNWREQPVQWNWNAPVFANINSSIAVKIEIEFSSWTLERREVIGVGYSVLKKVILKEFSYVRIYVGRVWYTHWQLYEHSGHLLWAEWLGEHSQSVTGWTTNDTMVRSLAWGS